MRVLPIRVSTHLAVRRADLKSAGLSVRDLRDAVERDNPDFWKLERMGLYTGATPRKLSLVEADAGELRLPRGASAAVAEVLAREGVRPEYRDETVSGTAAFLSTVGALEWTAPFRLHPDQRSAAKACVRGRSGIVIGPCGSGKTEIALKAISEIGERAVVVVHTERILSSWVEKARERFPRARVGAFYGKRKEPDADVVVGMVQSVRNRLRSEPGWARGFGTFVLDEAHHASAKSFSEVVSQFPARWRLAFTATPKRRDGKEALFFDAFGAEVGRSPRTGRPTSSPRTLFRVTDAGLERFGRILPIEVVVVPTEFEFDLHRADELERLGFERGRESALAAVRRWARGTGFGGPLNTYAEMLDAMARDKRRLARILAYLLPEVAAGEPCLLLADRREFCLEVRAWLRRRGVECGALMGGRQRAEAERTEADLRSGKIRVAVGTTVADEGMDVGALSRGFGCTPAASNPGRLTQQFGRFKRLSPGKADARYLYFWDRRVSALRGHLRAVAAAVRPPHTVWWSENPGSRVPLTRAVLARLERG